MLKKIFSWCYQPSGRRASACAHTVRRWRKQRIFILLYTHSPIADRGPASCVYRCATDRRSKVDRRDRPAPVYRRRRKRLTVGHGMTGGADHRLYGISTTGTTCSTGSCRLLVEVFCLEYIISRPLNNQQRGVYAHNNFHNVLTLRLSIIVMDKVVTCVAPVNIATIKYCKFPPRLYSFAYTFETTFIIFLILFPGGKRDEQLILPLNDSVSLTLDCDQVSFYCSNVHLYPFII